MRSIQPGPRSELMTDHLSRFDWRWKPFAELSTTEVYDMLAARSAVFIVEQNCVYGDVDGLDVDAWHLFAYGEGEQRPGARGLLARALARSAGSHRRPTSASVAC